MILIYLMIFSLLFGWFLGAMIKLIEDKIL